MLSVAVGASANAQYGSYTTPGYHSPAYQTSGSAVPLHPSLNPAYATGYRSPNSYQFYSVGQQVAPHAVGELIAPPAPVASAEPTPMSAYGSPVEHGPAPHAEYVPAIPATPASNPNCATCNQPAPAATYNPAPAATYTYSQPNIYVEAASTPGYPCNQSYAPAVSYAQPARIRPMFGSANILFLTRDDNYDRRLCPPMDRR